DSGSPSNSHCGLFLVFVFTSRRRHTRFSRDWSSDVCSSDLNASLGSDHNTSTPCFKGFTNTVITVYHTTGREIWSFDVLHKLIDLDIMIVYISNGTIHYFRKIVWRHIGCHSNCNTRGSINEQIWHPCWKHLRLL